MDIKNIEMELDKGKKLKDVLVESNITIEELLLMVLKDNNKLRELINQKEQKILDVLIDMRTPW